MGECIKNHLFAKPSIVEGVSRVIDLGATLQQYNYSNTPEEADAKAIFSDWLAVGNDIRSSIKNYERESKSITK